MQNSSKIYDLEYAEFVKDKRICLVGPAPHIINSKSRKLIDSFDLVCRIGKGFIIQKELKEDIGTRVDILYNVLNDSEKGKRSAGVLNIGELLSKKLKWICSANPPYFKCKIRNKKFEIKNNNRIPFHIINKEYYKEITKETGKWINTGLAAIIDLLYYDIKELYITGITFFSEKNKKYYYPQYRDPGLYLEDCYDREKQLNFIKKLYKKDKRIKCDKVLKKILES